MARQTRPTVTMGRSGVNPDMPPAAGVRMSWRSDPNCMLVGRHVQDKAEAKVAQMEARAEAQRKAKQAADAAWRKAQRERELQRAQVISHPAAKRVVKSRNQCSDESPLARKVGKQARFMSADGEAIML